MEKEYPKSAIKFFFKLNSNAPAPVSGLSNEILCNLVAQSLVKLWEVKEKKLLAGTPSTSTYLL